MFSKLNHFVIKPTLLLLFFLSSIPNGWSNTKTGSAKSNNLKIENARLTSIFVQLENQTDYRFSYGQEIINDRNTYSLDRRSNELQTVMNELAREAGLSPDLSPQ
jgi:TonB-dependent starch-binding outer membrane protein SusC